MDQRTAVYRAFDANGLLLYIGISDRWPARWCAHATYSVFYYDVVRLEIEWFPTRRDALDQEARAIRAERPKHNWAHLRDARLVAVAP